jgi:hypothetical protein
MTTETKVVKISLREMAATAMCADEAKLGHKTVQPGEVPWLPANEWIKPCCISITPKGEVRLVAIQAIHPGKGAFRRLVEAIERENMIPVVVCPMGRRMREIMTHWDWQRSVRIMLDGEFVEEFRPPTKVQQE